MSQSYKGLTIPSYADAADGPGAFQSFVDSGPIPRFADTTARDTAIQTPVEGQMVYIVASSMFQKYTGATWVNITADAETAASSALTAHTLAVDAHPEYLNEAEGDARYLRLTGGTVSGSITAGTFISSGGLAGSGTGRVLRSFGSGDYFQVDASGLGFYWSNVEKARFSTSGALQLDSALTVSAGGASIVGDVNVTGDVAASTGLFYGGTAASNDYLEVSEASNFVRGVVDGTEVFRAESGAFSTGATRLNLGIASTDYINWNESTDQWTLVGNGSVMFLVGTGSVASGADNSQSLGYNGNRWTEVWAANGTIQTSDPSLKNIHGDVPSGVLDRIKRAKPIEFEWLDDPTTRFGFDAEKLREEFPEVVVGEPGSLAIRTGDILALVAAGLAELAERVEALEAA